MQALYLLLGSNSGNRQKYIGKAKELIAERVGNIAKSSALYETAPWGNTERDYFLNQAILVFTEAAPEDILIAIKSIEQEAGRTATFRWGPREIDIDILLLGDTVFENDVLKIPHRELQNRKFALAALHDIAADVMHPVLNKTVAQLLADCPDAGEVKPLHTNASHGS